MDEVWELYGILNKEDRNVISNNVWNLLALLRRSNELPQLQTHTYQNYPHRYRI
jgi:hypothetical protein